jgi:hypothetical protein
MTDRTHATPAGDALERIASANRKMMETAGRATARSAQGMIAAQKRLMDFAARRLRADLDAAAALGRCARPDEVAATAQAFCAKALSDYAQETAELLRAAAAGARDEDAGTRH